MGTIITVLSFLLAAGALGMLFLQNAMFALILGWGSLFLRILYKCRFTINIK